jgi:hypothetical protein
MYKGEILATMAAFKQHATFGFWRGSQVVGDGREQLDAMGQFGRLGSVADLPEPEALKDFIHKAMALADAGVKPVRTRPLRATFGPGGSAGGAGRRTGASAHFDSFPPSCRREYVDWIVDAKRPETRAKRIVQAIEWMSEGKRRNWKYEQC